MNPLDITVDCEYMKAHTLERKLMNIVGMVKILHNPVIKGKEQTLERNPMNVISVVKPFNISIFSK